MKRGNDHPLGRWRAVAWLAALAAAAACDRRIEPYVPGEEPREPDLSRIFPERDEAGQPVRPDAAEPPSAPMGSRAPGLLPPEGSAGGPPVTGRVRLGTELGYVSGTGAVLFIIAKRGEGPGPPLAVVRVPDPEFPVAFQIGPENVMIPSQRFEGDVVLSARLDRDGNALTREPGDLQTTALRSATAGDRDVEIVLDTRL